MKYVIAPNFRQYQRYVLDQIRDHGAEQHDFRFVTDATMIMGYLGDIIVLNSRVIQWRNGLRETLNSRSTHPEVTVRYVDT